MSEDRDPFLEQVFAEPVPVSDRDQFVASVMANVNGLRRRRLSLTLVASLFGVLVLGLMLAPVAGELTSILLQPVFKQSPAAGGPGAMFLGPVNNFAGLSALAVMGVYWAYRWLFSRG